jgi:two-component system NarL family sensor kinase
VNGGPGIEAIRRRQAGRAEHIIGWLRLAAVVLLAEAERLPPPGDYNVAFFSVLGAYAAWAVAMLVWTRRRSLSPSAGLAATGIDVLVITALSMLSGGAFSLTRLGYFIIPVTVAFRYRPSLTLAATGVSVAAYVLQPLLDIGPDQGDIVGFVVLDAAMLAWVGVGCAALSAEVSRRSRQVERLAHDRVRLLAEALAAETRERRALADGLHDGAVQTLLAVRHDIEDVAIRAPAEAALDRADDALLGVVRDLRLAIFELHPHVLEEAGLEAAVRQVAEAAARRGGFSLELELDELPAHETVDRLLFSAGRELLTNVVKHAHAEHVVVTLRDSDGERVLTVSDDGGGFDAAMLGARPSTGHIGLASHRVRLETAGGRLEIGPAQGGGTIASAALPIQTTSPSPNRSIS